VSTKTIGAGGGSIGWIDPGGFLQVGPQSAGADPGPACYGSGGEEPTLTDANVALGRLNPEFFLGGSLSLDPGLSRAALGRVASTLGTDAVQVASSMIRIANENMANAVRIVTVEEGVDPRDHALIAMGGAGPTHAAEIAEAIGMDRVIVPLHPGLTSAFGALAAEVRVDEVKSVNLKSTVSSAGTVDALFAELQATAVENFRAQGSSPAEPAVARSIAMRYEGQNYEQEIPVPDGPITDALLADVFERYHQLHHEFYGYRLDALPVELVRLLVTATAADTAPLPALSLDVRGDAPAGERPAARTAEVHFGDAFQTTPVVARTELIGAAVRQGPLIVESMDTTVVVPPGWAVESDPVGILELRRTAAPAPPQTTTGAVGAAN
jgi:N-methylhydantoinase A